MATKVRINVKTEGGYDALHPETEAEQVVMTGYAKPAQGGAVTPGDTALAAIGKLEAGVGECIPKEDIVQVQGRSETKVMSQRAVSDAIDAAGGGGGGTGDAEPVGTIKQFGGETLPDGYLWCDGASYPANGDYRKLFEVIGTAYNGEDDAEGTFRVPDLRGRVAVGKNEGTFGALGKTGGEETHTLTTEEMPSHNHSTSINIAYAITKTAGNDGWIANASGSQNTGNKGGGGAHNNLQPYLVCNYIIKYGKTYGEIGVTAPPCIWEFSASDWLLGEDSVYTLSIPESEHRRGEYCVLTALYDTSEEGKMKAVLFEMEKDGDGNITVYSAAAFPGTAYIDRVYMVPAGRVLTVNGQGPDADGDVTVAEVENAQKLGGKAADSYMQKSGGTFTGDISTKNIIPNTGGVSTLGTAAKEWNNIYTDNISRNAAGYLVIRCDDDVMVTDESGGYLRGIRVGAGSVSNGNALFVGDYQSSCGVLSTTAFYVGNIQGTALQTIYAQNISGSAKRFKEDIRELTPEEAEKVLKMLPVAFNWKEGAPWTGESISYIADDVAEIDDRFVFYSEDADGNRQVEGLQVNPFLAAFGFLIKENRKRIVELEEKAEKFDALSALLVEKGILTQEEMDGLMAKTDETEGKV